MRTVILIVKDLWRVFFKKTLAKVLVVFLVFFKSVMLNEIHKTTDNRSQKGENRKGE